MAEDVGNEGRVWGANRRYSDVGFGLELEHQILLSNETLGLKLSAYYNSEILGKES
jgi:hypothetical protein